MKAKSRKIKYLIICFVLLVISLGFINKDKVEVNKKPQAVIPEIVRSDTPKDIQATTTVEIIEILPKVIYPGDPIFITINSSTTPESLMFDGILNPVFTYNGLPRSLLATLFEKEGRDHDLEIKLSSGEIIKKQVKITSREKIERPLGIPEKLGGDTPEAAKALAKNLANENYVINNIKSAKEILWTEPFTFPLQNIFITDDYGYDRKTVTETIAHKGTDFRVATGTPVMAMNDGVVSVARLFTVYGNAVIIDHGLGVQTLYMHMSELQVKEGDVVKKGDIIGLSGDLGYVTGAHLHISVKINGVSIDPMTFLGFFINTNK